jgi:tryptophanyl-tRNA synthetase
MTGDKMSSSKPKTTLFLGDDISTAEKKIKKSFSGGQSTVEEHRRLGGDPDKDVAYQYMMYFFEEDDSFLEEINQGYRSGKILAGEMKQLCIDRASEWLSELSEKRDETAHLIERFFE